jgi:hypothetical protein
MRGPTWLPRPSLTSPSSKVHIYEAMCPLVMQDDLIAGYRAIDIVRERRQLCMG